MAYFEDDDGRRVMLASVKWHRRRPKEGKVEGKGEGDVGFSVDLDEFDRAHRYWFQAVVPAAPGTYLLERCPPEDPTHPMEWDRQKVVAWGVNHDSALVPLQLGDRAFLGEPFVVLHPDGRVEVDCEGSFPNFEAFAKANGGGFLND